MRDLHGGLTALLPRLFAFARTMLGDSDSARDLVQEAGYRSGLTCIRGAANYAANPYEIPRKAISYGDNLIGYAWKLNFKHVPKRQP